MTCHFCNLDCVKAGRYGAQKVQRYTCKSCGKRFSDAQEKPLCDVRLPPLEGPHDPPLSRSGQLVCGTARLCDVEKRTVLRILKLAGENCERPLERKVRNVEVEDVELDEVWTFVGEKERRKTGEEGPPGHRRSVVFTALESNSKMVLGWHLGRRDNPNTWDSVTKLRDATPAKRFNLRLTPSPLTVERSARDSKTAWNTPNRSSYTARCREGATTTAPRRSKAQSLRR